MEEEKQKRFMELENTKDKLYITDAKRGFTAQDTKRLLRQLK